MTSTRRSTHHFLPNSSTHGAPVAAQAPLTQLSGAQETGTDAQRAGQSDLDLSPTVMLPPPGVLLRFRPGAISGPPALPADAPIAVPMTLQSLDAWAAAPGQVHREEQQRAVVVDRLAEASPSGARKLKKLLDLNLAAMRYLTSLPGGLNVAGNLYLRDCTALTQLCEALTVAGSLNLTNCTALARLPENLSVAGDLELRNCTSLTQLPPGLWVGSDLQLGGCTSLIQLPAGLRVGRDLQLHGCTALAQMPERLSVTGHLQLGGCTALTQLPAALRVEHGLDLSDCTALTHLPDPLWIAGDLDLTSCLALTHLPARLATTGNLSLSDCPALTQLPETLSVGGHLYLACCTALTELPDSILQWPLQTNGLPHHIDISGSGIDAARGQALQHLAGPGVQLYNDVEEEDAEEDVPFTSLCAALAFWRPLVGSGAQDANADDSTAPDVHADPQQLRSYLFFMGRLRGTADYQNIHSRPLLARRMVSLTRQLASSESLAALCHERIGQALESCGDRVIWAMNQLELTVRVHQAQQGSTPEQALRDLGRSLLRLQVVHQHAAAKVVGLTVVDPIEVYLAYETKLAQPLGLPLSTQGMLYERSSNVSEADLEAASQAAKQAEADPQQAEAFLASWEPWQGLVRRQQAEACTWQSLPRVPEEVRFDSDQVCVLTQETVADLQASGSHIAALRDAGGGWVPYDFQSLLKWWTQQGTHPVQLSPIGLRDIHRMSD
jgi:hypothetical protein